MLMQRQRVAARNSQPAEKPDDPPTLGGRVKSFPAVLLLLVGVAIVVLIAGAGLLPSSSITVAVSLQPAPTPGDLSSSPPSPPQASSKNDNLVHIAVATDETEPFGLLSLINSTVSHSSSGGSDVRFHIIVPATSRRRLRMLFESLFSAPSFRMYSLDVGGARAKILRHLRRREREPVLISPFRYALGYLPLVLPQGLRRVVWVQTDALVLADVRELYEAPLNGGTHMQRLKPISRGSNPPVRDERQLRAPCCACML